MSRKHMAAGLTVAASVLVLASCVALMATASTTADRTVLSPVFSENTEPTLVWNGLPENYKFDPFRDEEVEPHTKNGKDPFGPKGQYGMWMGIQGDTINGFGCGPKGPMDCFVGTTPSEHWARGRKSAMRQQQLAAVATQQLSPVYSENTEPTLVWNGLPENYKFDPFRDEEVEPHTKNGKDPFGPKGQYGMWMGIQPDTEERRFGCGPGGPMDCFVGTTPSEHWVRGSGLDRAKQKQLAAVKEAKKQQLTYWEERTLQPSRQQRWYQVDPLVVVHAHTRKHALPHRTATRNFGDTDVVPHDHHTKVHGIAGRWPDGGRSGPWLGRCGPSAHVRRGGCGIESCRSQAWRAGTRAAFSRGQNCAGVHLPECAGRDESAVQGQ